MADLSKIKLDGTTYNLKDTVARDGLATIPTKINDLTEYKNFGIGYIDCTNINRYIFISNVTFSSSDASDFSSYFLLMFIKRTESGSITIAGTGNFKFYDINSNTLNGYVAQISSATISTLKYGTLYIARLNDGILDLYPLTTRSEVNSLITSAIGNINSFEVSVVASLPAFDIDTHTIYFVSNSSSGDSIYDEYMYINNNWEKIGSTAVDLSNYLQKTDISDWAKASTKPSYTASEVGALPDTTTIPTKTSDLTNDSGYITSVPVTSVNNQTGDITLSASDVGALPDTTVIPVQSVNGMTGNVVVPDPFMLLDFNQIIDVLIPSCLDDIPNTSITNVDVSITNEIGADWAIASLAKYEVFDAEAGGNRINVFPVCMFSMNGQKILRLRMMAAGPNKKHAKRISGALLLKHR